MASVALGYLRAVLAKKPGLKAGATIPRLTATIPAAVPPAAQIAGIRRELGLADDGMMPFIYPHIAGFATFIGLMTDPRFPLPILGTVHLRSEITQARPVRASEALRVDCEINGHRVVDKGIEFDWQTRVLSGDELVWQGTAVLLSRQKTGASAKDRLPAALEALHAPETTVIAADAGAARRWARVSNDYNPIHLSAMTAKLFGFRGQIMHGMWTVGRVTALNRARLARSPARLSCEMKLPVFPPAELRVLAAEDGDALRFQVLDKDVDKPHLIGRMS